MKQDIRICTVVIGRSLEEFLFNLEKIQQVSNFMELRVDYIENLKLEDLDIIKKFTFKESILTCRSVEEGGLFQGSAKELLEIIYKANKLGFKYIDMEISKLNLINKNYLSGDNKTIGSYHNFKKTPCPNELQNIAERIANYSFVDIIKIATISNSDADNFNLLRLLKNKSITKPLIVLGMGENGKVTRVLSPLLGGYLTFASLDKCKTASGQIELGELKNMLTLMQK